MTSSAPLEWWRPLPAESAGLEAPARPEAHAAKPSSPVAFGALVAFTFILILAPQDLLPVLRPFRIALLTAVVGIGAHLLDCFFERRPLIALGRETALTLALVGWTALTLPFSYWAGGSAAFLLGTFLKTVALFLMLGTVVDTLPRLRRIAWCLTAMAVPLALTGVSNLLSGEYVQVGSVKRIVGYEGGFTKNPNGLALMLALMLPFTIALARSARRRAVRALLVAIALLETAGVLVTFSRAGFLTLAATFAIALWRAVRRGRALWPALAVVAALAGVQLLPSGYASRLSTIADIDADPTGSAQARWRDTAAAMRLIADNPIIGAGVGMNSLALNEVRGATWTLVHNVYLEYGVELGLPGLVLFVALLCAAIGKARAVRRRVRPSTESLRELSCLAEGVETALLAFAVAALFYPVGYQFYFYYLAGLSVAADAVHERLSAGDHENADERDSAVAEC
jgi:O-antigen ligase